MAGKNFLGDELVNAGLINLDQLQAAEKERKKVGGHLNTILIKMKALDDKKLMTFLERKYQAPSVDLGNFKIPKETIALVTQEICEEHVLIPISKVGKTLVVAFSDPSSLSLRDDLSFLTRCKIQVVLASEYAILASIEKYYGRKEVELSSFESSDVNKMASAKVEFLGDSSSKSDEPIVQFVNAILAEAIRKGASDIHIEPYEKKFRVRYRIDGSLQETTAPPSGIASSVSSRIKVMCRMDIAERRRPQDGRLKVLTQDKKEIDFRVNTVPTLFGEKIVMRILDKSTLQVDMTKLGFERDDLQIFKEIINRPQGMVLLTGPTGSGKTTTIYSALAELNRNEVNICTAEDPVEFNLEGINQVQVNPDIDLTFANSLRSFLRQDPDIIMVGEIRDFETAEIAFKAASTGHMVVSTLHTNDAPATISRLVDMGVAPFMITSTISIVVAQRLVGKICEDCKTPSPSVTAEVLINLGVLKEEVEDYKVMEAKGCNFCFGTGIKGRLAIFEMMTINTEMKEAILSGASPVGIRKIAFKSGMRTLRRSALLKLKAGLTTVEDVLNSSIKDN